MTTNVKCLLYVDDFAIYTVSTYVPSLERVTVNNASLRASNHGFKFSTNKTVAIHFHRKWGLSQEPKLFLCNQPIFFKSEAKNSELTFDYRFNWKPYIRFLKQERLEKLNLLRCISHVNWGAYRITMISSAKNCTINTLDPVLNSAIRLATESFKSSELIAYAQKLGNHLYILDENG